MVKKETLNTYWVTVINNLLGKANLEQIKPDEFLNLNVYNTPDKINISILCTGKLIVLNLDGQDGKMSGGIKRF